MGLIETPAVMAHGARGRPAPRRWQLPRKRVVSRWPMGSRSSPFARDVAPHRGGDRSCSAAEAEEDPPGKAGLASITAEMLDEGAGTRDAPGARRRARAPWGPTSGWGSGRDGSQLSVQAPRETVPGRTCASRATWWRALALSDGLAPRAGRSPHRASPQRRDQPDAVVNVVSDRLLYGDGHPYDLAAGRSRADGRAPDPRRCPERSTPPTTDPSIAFTGGGGRLRREPRSPPLEEVFGRLAVGSRPAPCRRPFPAPARAW